MIRITNQSRQTLFVLLTILTFGLSAQTTFTVTSTADAGAGSLRQAIIDAEANPGADNIDLTGLSGTITLASALPDITQGLTFNGPTSNTLAIDGANTYRIFFIVNATAPVVRIFDLTLQNGLAKGQDTGNGGAGAGMGGAIYADNAELFLGNVILDGNIAQGGNGGVSGPSSGGAGPFNTGGAAGASAPNGSQGGTGGFGSGGGAGGTATVTGGGSAARGGTGGYGAGGGAPGVPNFNGGPTAPGGTGGTFGGSTNGLPSNQSASSRSGGGGAGLGGALFVRAGSLDLNEVTFTNNEANKGLGGAYSNDGQGKGGALFLMDGVPAAGIGVNFTGNTASNAGTSETDDTNQYGSIDLITPIAITSQPSDITVDEGANAIATIEVSGSGATYQWQVFVGAWVDLVDDATNSGVTTNTLVVTCPTADFSGSQTRCVVTGTLNTVTSDPATLTVNPAPALEVTVSGETGIACDGASLTFTASPANNTTAPVYQWYVNDQAVTNETNETFTANFNIGDEVYVTLSEPGSCFSRPTVPSNDVTITASELVIFVTNTLGGVSDVNSLAWAVNEVNNYSCSVEAVIDLRNLPDNSTIILNNLLGINTSTTLIGKGSDLLTITANTSNTGSGQIFTVNDEGIDLTLEGMTIENTGSTNHALYVTAANTLTTLTDVLVDGFASDGIYIQGQNAIFTNVSSTNNGAAGLNMRLHYNGTGGALSIIGGNFSDNFTWGVDFSEYESFTADFLLDQVIFENNERGFKFYGDADSGVIKNCSFIGQTQFGMEISADTEVIMDVSNCTFAQNGTTTTGPWQGALYFDSNINATVNNCTIANNSFGVIAANAAVDLNNCILLGQIRSNTHLDDGTISSSYGHNLGVALGPNSDENVQLADVLDPGLSEVNGLKFYELVSCSSPAIDAGDNSSASEFDQLGNPRIGSADIGAIEFQDGITAQPQGKTIDPTIASAPLFISVDAVGATAYQWQVDDGSGFVTIELTDSDYAGADTDLLTINTVTAGNAYRVEVTTACGATLSETAAIIAKIIWDGADWSNVTGPVAGDDVILKGDLPFIGAIAIEIADLTVESGVTLTIGGGATATITGDVISDGTIIVESGSSLVTFEGNKVANDIIVRRNTRYADGKYSFVGTPVAQSALNIGSDLGNYVFTYNEATPYDTDGINRWEDAATDELVPGTGYTQAEQQLIEFVGRPNMGTITYQGTYTQDTDDANEGWNLVSNPYTAAIKVSDFLMANDNTTGAVYIWDDNGSNLGQGSNSDYIVANGLASTQNSNAGNDTRYNLHLGSAQGFFVQLDGLGDNTISFTESMRIGGENSDDNFFRKAEDKPSIVRVNLTNTSGLFKQTVIGWVADAVDGLINLAYDARVFSQAASYALYSIKGDEKLAITGVSLSQSEIPLGMNVGEPGSYQLALDTETYQGEQMYLFDSQTNRYHDFSTGAYSFTSAKGMYTDRFSLVVGAARVLSTVSDSDWKVFAAENTLYIRSSLNERVLKEYGLYDLSGKFLFVVRVDSNDGAQIDLSAYNKGVYIVSDGIHSTKIIIE